MDKPNIVLVGHCCLDKVDSGFTLGGTVSYINAILNSRNIKPTLITAFGDDFAFKKNLEGTGSTIIIQESPKTTIFQNIYANEGRKQFLLIKGSDIEWRPDYSKLEPIDILMLCPIADEVNYSFIQKFKAKLKIATIQGWLRMKNQDNSIRSKWIEPKKLAGLDLVIFSTEDLPDYRKYIDEIISVVPILVVTNGKHGAEVYMKGIRYYFPSFEITETDPTGAGDSFACGLALKYYETQNIDESVIYGHAIAAIVVENKGVYFPSETEVAQKLPKYPKESIIKF